MEILEFKNYLSIADLRDTFLSLLKQDKSYTIESTQDHISIVDKEFESFFDVQIISPSQIILYIKVSDIRAIEKLAKILKGVGSIG